MFVLLLSSSAFAWKHTGFFWPASDVPLRWWMDDSPVEESLPGDVDAHAALIEDAWDNWPAGAPCAGMDNDYRGLVDGGLRDYGDGKIVFYWDDPGDEQAPGVLGVTYTVGDGGEKQTKNGAVYSAPGDVDIVFNNDVDFGLTEDMVAGTCNNGNEIAFEGVATHEIGHLWGFGHSCEENASCPEEARQQATMYWSVSPCDTHQADINEDDINGANALYGATGTFTATSPTSGAVPFTVEFAVTSEEDIQSVQWTWGDGSEEVGTATASHTYTVAGAFTVSAAIGLSSDECGTSTFKQTEIAYVRSCAVPVPEEGSEGLFQLEPSTGLVWQTVNHTDMSTYGCVDTIQWEVYEGSDVDASKLVDFNGDGEGDSIGAWAPLLQFPAEGTYTIVMNVGGPGGISAGKMTIDVADLGSTTSSCSSTPQLTLAGAALAGLAALRRRRRG